MSTQADHSIERALRGEIIFGDDFSPQQIAEWYADEKEGYADLGAKDSASYVYHYHALNTLHGYDRLPRERRFRHALGMGAAYGAEFEPLANRIDRITIVDPSDAFVSDRACGVPASWVKPDPSGTLPFADASFDLLTCFGVLHHIPNVSHVAKEMRRVLAHDGYVLIREPVVSMGDWRHRRPGLTKRERGFPRPLFRRLLNDAGFRVLHESLCMFRPWVRAVQGLGVDPFGRTWATRIDATLSNFMSWNQAYHPRSVIQKIRPASLFVVLTPA